jgi:hypothetical protein
LSSIPHSAHIYLWPGASIGQATIEVLLSIYQSCRIRRQVYAVKLVTYLGSCRSAIRIMRKVRHDKISRLVHGLALGFSTGMVCACSLSSCHGGPLLWQTQIRICQRGTPVPSIPVPSSPAPIRRSFSPFHFLTLPHTTLPSLPFLRGLGYYYGKIADARRRDLAHSGN